MLYDQRQTHRLRIVVIVPGRAAIPIVVAISRVIVDILYFTDRSYRNIGRWLLYRFVLRGLVGPLAVSSK